MRNTRTNGVRNTAARVMLGSAGVYYQQIANSATLEHDCPVESRLKAPEEHRGH